MGSFSPRAKKLRVKVMVDQDEFILITRFGGKT